MAKKVAKICKLQFVAGQAKPGPALASAGINMPQFCTQFNDQTKDRHGDIVPVVITASGSWKMEFQVLQVRFLSVRILLLQSLSADMGS